MASGQYSIAKHTLLPLIYTIKTASSFTYLLRDPSTHSLLLLPSLAPKQELKYHIENIQQQFKCKLTHTFTNSEQERERGKLFNEQLVNADLQGDLRPLLVGELSICYISAAGYRPDYNLVAVTHSTPTSTKFSVLFPGSLISVCSIDWQRDVKAALYLQTLNKLKYFPSQTLIFPEKQSTVDDLHFAKALGGNSVSGFLDQKLQTLQGSQEGSLIPTSMLAEKMLNPFLAPEKYSSLLKASDRTVCFDLLRRMRKQWNK